MVIETESFCILFKAAIWGLLWEYNKPSSVNPTAFAVNGCNNEIVLMFFLGFMKHLLSLFCY